MSWHDHCTGLTGMKKNRYAFIRYGDDDTELNRVKYGSNMNDKFWVVCDNKLTESQLTLILGKLGIRISIDKLINEKVYYKMDKIVYWMEIEW